MKLASLLRTLLLATATVTLAAIAGCGSDDADASDPPANTDQDSGAQQEASLPGPDAGPDTASEDAEPGVDATTDDAPASDDAAAPDAADDDAAMEDAAEDVVTAPTCKNEVDLSTETLPCDCYGTLVTDPAAQMPTCTKTVVCCPGIQGLKCE